MNLENFTYENFVRPYPAHAASQPYTPPGPMGGHVVLATLHHFEEAMAETSTQQATHVMISSWKHVRPLLATAKGSWWLSASLTQDSSSQHSIFHVKHGTRTIALRANSLTPVKKQQEAWLNIWMWRSHTCQSSKIKHAKSL